MGCANSAPAVAAPAAKPEAKAATPKQQGNSFFDKYRLAGKLGKGGFAQVRALSDGGLAVKIMDLRKEDANGRWLEDSRYRKEAVEEAGAWRAAGHHDNIVCLQDAFLESGACFFVMERCDQTFQRYIISIDLNERALVSIFSQLFTGLAHVHSRNVVHRDIKPDNVMVSGSVCKLCDFGLAGVLPASGAGLTGVYGTAPFMCPEMLDKKPYKTEADVWSMGVMLYVLCFGGFPYLPEIKNSTEMKRVIREGRKLPTFSATPVSRAGKVPSPLPKVSIQAQRCCRLLLIRGQHDRITAEAVLKETFLASQPQEKLPSLAPILAMALKSGAFENRKVDKVDGELDPLLAKLHKRQTGLELKQDTESPRTKKPFVASDASQSTTASTASVVSDTSSRHSTTSTVTPRWQTNNMSIGGRHHA